jgi:hypothetical protein
VIADLALALLWVGIGIGEADASAGKKPRLRTGKRQSKALVVGNDGMRSYIVKSIRGRAKFQNVNHHTF